MGDKGCAEERSAHANLHVTSCKNERARRKWVGGMEKRRWREGVCTKEANARANSHVTSCKRKEGCVHERSKCACKVTRNILRAGVAKMVGYKS